MWYACTTVHGRGSPSQSRIIPGFGLRAASSHVRVWVVAVLSSTWMTCPIVLYPREWRQVHKVQIMAASKLSTYGDRGHTSVVLSTRTSRQKRYSTGLRGA